MKLNNNFLVQFLPDFTLNLILTSIFIDPVNKNIHGANFSQLNNKNNKPNVIILVKLQLLCTLIHPLTHLMIVPKQPQDLIATFGFSYLLYSNGRTVVPTNIQQVRFFKKKD